MRYPDNWKQEIWIASKLNELEDEDGNVFINYDRPGPI
jgi:hypothetical protein